jgi:putative glycosyltransferase
VYATIIDSNRGLWKFDFDSTMPSVCPPKRQTYMKLSIITTLYYSAPYIEEFYERSLKTALQITPDIEFVFVNDGSPDNVLDVVRRLADQDERITVVDLSRNFGHHPAIMAGLAYTTGDLVFLMDCDLEEAPETLTEFYTALVNDPDADAVYAVQKKREGPALRRWPGDLYYRVINALSDFHVPHNMMMARLTTQRFVQDLLKHQERIFAIEGLWQLTGYKQIPIIIEKTYKGTTTYTWSKKIALAIASLTAMSSKPLTAIASLGLLMVIPSSIAIILLFVQRLDGYTNLPGWTSILVSLWFLSGLIIFILGILGIYLSVIFTEVKQRPNSIVRNVYRSQKPNPTPRPYLPPLNAHDGNVKASLLPVSEHSSPKGSS